MTLWAVAEEVGISILKYAFNKGIIFVDTSDIYGHEYANEFLVGKVILFYYQAVYPKGLTKLILGLIKFVVIYLLRENVQLATKFGTVKIGSHKIKANGSSEYVRSCCEVSLKRLDIVPIKDFFFALLKKKTFFYH